MLSRAIDRAICYVAGAGTILLLLGGCGNAGRTSLSVSLPEALSQGAVPTWELFLKVAENEDLSSKVVASRHLGITASQLERRLRQKPITFADYQNGSITYGVDHRAGGAPVYTLALTGLRFCIDPQTAVQQLERAGQQASVPDPKTGITRALRKHPNVTMSLPEVRGYEIRCVENMDITSYSRSVAIPE